MSRLRLLAVGAALWLSAAPPDLWGQEDQARVAQLLLHGTLEERRIAVVRLVSIEPTEWSAELKAAAIATLEHEGMVRTSQEGIGESIVLLSRSVADLRDPITIPAVIRVVNTRAAMRALVKFGDEALMPLADFVAVTDSQVHQVGGLTALRCMVERTDDSPLSDASRERVREVAEARLRGVEEWTTLNRAIDLASILDDPLLMRLVRELASDSSAVAARGISDPDAIERVQRRANDRLAGIAPGPRC